MLVSSGFISSLSSLFLYSSLVLTGKYMFINDLDKMLGTKDEFENSQVKKIQMRDLSEGLTEIIDRIVLPSDFNKLSEKQINYLLFLKNKWKHEKDSRETIGLIKDILGIKSKMVDRKDGYLITKGLK